MSVFSQRQLAILHRDYLRPAYAAQRDRALALGLPWDDSTGGYDRWRHAFLELKVGRAGLRCCTQGDYRQIQAHCLDAMGHPDAAANMLMEDPDANEKRQARWLLARALREGGLDPSYAEAIARRQFKRPLDDLGLNQLWNILFTIRARAKSRKPILAPDS